MSVLAELVARRRDAEDPIRIAVGDPSTLGVETSSAGRDGPEVTRGERATEPDAETAVDPVCGMTVDVDDGTPSIERDGERFHFCCRGCADAFADDPEEYLDGVSPDV